MTVKLYNGPTARRDAEDVERLPWFTIFRDLLRHHETPPEITAYSAAQDMDVSEVLRQAHAVMKANREDTRDPFHWCCHVRWFNDRSFGFITPTDGGEDVYIHWKQLVGTKGLRQGDTVSYNTEYDNSKGEVQGEKLHRHIQRS